MQRFAAPSTLTVDEAALSGESLPVEKHTDDDGHAARLYAGTSIVSGIGRAMVTATGTHTQFGAIARALVEKAPPTEYERSARAFGVVGEATTGREAVEQARRLQADVVLMDLNMPEMNGLDATPLLSTRQPETKLVILTAPGAG